MAHVAVIAQRPHPVGSPDHDRVRDYLRSQFAQYGLTAQVETGLGRYEGPGATIENVLTRLPGTANTRPVMLVAHYDSVSRGPGAGDDGHGVAVLLETLRALKASPPLRNDAIFLVTDGEEIGLVGAAVFARDHPWRKEPGVVLNFEARGTSGIPQMFETSEGNLWLARNLQQAVPQAAASSFAYEVYRRMPNGTDLTIFKRQGLAGMNFAFIEHPELYHSRHDDVAHLDRHSVQEQGRYALALARQFGNQDLSSQHSGDAVYFPTKLTPLIVYPVSLVFPSACLLTASLLMAFVAGIRHRTRGLWMAAPLGVVAALMFLAAQAAPGVSYLLEWPFAAAAMSFLLLVSAPELVKPGIRVALLMLAPAGVTLILLPLPGVLAVALGWRGAAPIVIVDLLVVLVCLAPQLALMVRGQRGKPGFECQGEGLGE